MRSLYLRIYVTVVAVLLVFALVAGWLFQRNVERERENMQGMWSERAAGWASLLENSLPARTAPIDEQRAALLDWSRKLRLPLALDDANGQRIATSEPFARREAESGGPPPRAIRLQLSDGRALWISRGQGARVSGSGGDSAPRRGPPPAFPGGPPTMLPGSGVGLAVTLLVLFFAIALGAYPVVRRLTRRLESLKKGVEIFGAGKLSHRVDEGGRDEVAAVAASFNQAAQRVEALLGSHRNMLANASHELRSPLARLKMAVSLLENAGPEARDKLRAEIEHNIRELDALVEEVLLASRLDVPEQTDPQERVELLALAAEEASRVNGSVSGDDVAVRGNERLLRRALRNLLENAVRYGNGEPPELCVKGGKAEVQLRVSDRGPGVPPAQRERIFEPFYRLPGHAEKAGGVGLGLSLVRQIASAHKGKVYCEPREGGGSCFVLSLPVAGRTP
jgi:signal transduction histidine kinase